MRRREFIVGLAGTVACSRAASAQQPAVPVVGFLALPSADHSDGVIAPFLQGLKEAGGYIEGSNVVIEYCWAENRLDRLRALAADLVRRRVVVIAAYGSTAGLAAKAATATIPVVFSIAGDPVQLGLVASLDRPGANVTGHAVLSTELAPKRLQMLRELVPDAARFGILVDPASSSFQSVIPELQTAAHTLGLQLVFVNARTDGDLEAAFSTFSQQRVGAVLFSSSTFYNGRMEHLAALAVRHALPAIFQYAEFALAGGLMSYGSSLSYVGHQAGIYTARILKGDKPADLPVEQATKIELTSTSKPRRHLGSNFRPDFWYAPTK
jgi:putative tryptophan/tyrosine transport system substrate-binding protein